MTSELLFWLAVVICVTLIIIIRTICGCIKEVNKMKYRPKYRHECKEKNKTSNKYNTSGVEVVNKECMID